MHESPARIGLGMIRIDPRDEAHRAAVREALSRGVRDFDLGFIGDPSFAARAELVRGESAAMGAAGLRLLVRGELGEAGRVPSATAALRSGPSASAFATTYLVSDPELALGRFEGDFGKLYVGIREELELLERAFRAGEIAAYGIGSAGFAYAKEDPEFLSLISLFDDLSGDPLAVRARFPGFRAIEFPFNLHESTAAWLPSQTLAVGEGNGGAISAGTGTLLEAAQAFGLETYARRPFDALTSTRLLRLASYPDHHRLDLDEAVKRTLEVALVEEAKLIEWIERIEWIEPIRIATETPNDPRELPPSPSLHWAHRLRRQLIQVSDPEQWKEIVRRRIVPELEASYSALAAHPALAAHGATSGDAVSRYRDAMDALLMAVRLWFEKTAAERNERIRARIATAAPSLRGEKSLTRTAVRLYRSIPGLDCVLIGMRSARYVEEILSPDPLPIASDEAGLALEAARETIDDYLVLNEAEARPPENRESR